MDDDQVDPKKTRSVAQKREGFTVPSSPFNPVKLELGIILILGVAFFTAHEHITADANLQFILLAGYGGLAAGWLVLRIRIITRRIYQSGPGAQE